MGIFSDVLLTVDYDRTLTAPDSTIPARNLEAIQYFMENGGAFTVNTGRSLPMAQAFLGKVPANVPFLLYNGSAAYLPGQGLSLLHPIDLDQKKTMETLMAAFPDLTVEIQGVDAHYNFIENPDWNTFCDHNGCARGTTTPEAVPAPFLKFSLYGEFHDPTVAGLFSATEPELARMNEAEEFIKARYGDKVVVFRAAPRIIDVHARGVSKAIAARELQRTLGRSILVCVGDAENDVSMLEGADYAFCPADAILGDRFPNVCPCGEGAVADVICKKIPEILKITIDK